VEKLTMSGGKLFQTFMTRSVKKTDLVVLLQWCLNNFYPLPHPHIRLLPPSITKKKFTSHFRTITPHTIPDYRQITNTKISTAFI